MRHTLTLLLVLLISITVSPQKQSNRWYFGANSGMDFNDLQTVNTNLGEIHGLPKEVKGPFNTGEGCFSISSKEGDFLFSSDGRIAYNKVNQPMPNGKDLRGNGSSAQSGIVVPMPGDEKRYYLFTTPEITEGKTKQWVYYYSIVNIDADNGNGDIESGKKNIPLSLAGTGYNYLHTSENLTSVKHTNDKDYWLVAKIWGDFVVWLITKDGISTPEKYPITNPQLIRHQGNIKFSPDGKKMIHTSNQNGYIHYADFEPSTGVVSNAKCTNTGLERTYGIEFSPNGKYIFIARIEYPSYQNPTSTGLFIRKIEDIGFTQAHVDDKKVLEGISNVQLGPDRRIYAIAGANNNPTRRNLYVILNPDEGGTQIATLTNFFAADRLPRYGLPPFITSFFSLKGIKGNNYPPIGKDEIFESYLVQGSGEYEIDYLEWDFGDGSPKVKQYYVPNSVTYPKVHAYKTIGEFKMVVHPYNTRGKLMEGSILTKDITTRTGLMIVNPANRSFYGQ